VRVLPYNGRQAIIKEQDRELEGIHEDVVLLGQMGRQIGDELDEQDGFVAILHHMNSC
jgi:hypothetical protein